MVWNDGPDQSKLGLWRWWCGFRVRVYLAKREAIRLLNPVGQLTALVLRSVARGLHGTDQQPHVAAVAVVHPTDKVEQPKNCKEVDTANAYENVFNNHCLPLESVVAKLMRLPNVVRGQFCFMDRHPCLLAVKKGAIA